MDTSQRHDHPDRHAHQHGQGPGHGSAQAGQDTDPRQWLTPEDWDDRYSGDALWSGQPNPMLVHYAAGLAPGRVLDVGSGEGADAIWLATQGWTVTGAAISPVVLERAATFAAEAGPDVAARVSWQQADLLAWAPPESHFDLVSAQFVHLPRPERE